MALDGWNWEDAVYKADDGVHLNWPIKYRKSGWWAEPGPNKANEKYNKTRDAIYTFFQEAFSYCLLYTSPSPRDGLLSRMPSSA